jgi:hypothetical protein
VDDVQRLFDEREIERKLGDYARALDGRAYDDLKEVFVADVRVRYGGGAWIEGLDAVVAYCRAVLDGLDGSQHRVGTVAIGVDGDSATSACYLAAEHILRGTEGGDRYTVGGTYLDRWQRTPGGWRIGERVLEMTWTDGNPAVVGAGRRAG